MKILLCCANGLSTSILMQKMRKWGKEKGIELEVGKPVDKINPADYGLGNVENIMKQVHKLLDK